MVSVVVPVYNVINYLPHCMVSLLNQNYKDYEIILIDDGSTDGSAEICDIYENSNKHVHVLHKRNEGVSAARNDGIKMATGQFITFVDADDWVDPNYLLELSQIMPLKGMAVCNCILETMPARKRMQEVKIDSMCDKNKEAQTYRIMRKEEAQISLIRRDGIHGYMCGKMFDRDVVVKNKLVLDRDISILEDTLFVFQYLNYAAGEVAWSKKRQYHYCQNPNSALNGRYHQVNFDIRTLSEYLAIERILHSKQISKEVKAAYQLQQAKSNINTLRVMTANQYDNRELYNNLLHFARKYCVAFLESKLFPPNAKISLVFGCIHPKLEYKVWKIVNAFRR